MTFAATRPFLKASRKFAHHLRNCHDCGKGPLNNGTPTELCHTGRSSIEEWRIWTHRKSSLGFLYPPRDVLGP